MKRNNLFLVGAVTVAVALVVMAGCASTPVDLAGRQKQVDKKGFVVPAVDTKTGVAAISLTVWAAEGTDPDGNPDYIEFTSETAGMFHATWGDSGTPFTYTVEPDGEDGAMKGTITVDGKAVAYTIKSTGEKYRLGALDGTTTNSDFAVVSELSYQGTTYAVTNKEYFANAECLYSIPRGPERLVMVKSLIPGKEAFFAAYGTEGIPKELLGMWQGGSGKNKEIQFSTQGYPPVTGDMSGSYRYGLANIYAKGNMIYGVVPPQFPNGSGFLSAVAGNIAAGKNTQFVEGYSEYLITGLKATHQAPNSCFEYSIDGNRLTISNTQGYTGIFEGTYTKK